jgi:hypothetical protein
LQYPQKDFAETLSRAAVLEKADDIFRTKTQVREIESDRPYDRVFELIRNVLPVARTFCRRDAKIGIVTQPGAQSLYLVVGNIARTLDHTRPMPDRFDDGILDAWRSRASQIKVLDPPAQAPRPPQGIFGYRFKLDGPIHVVKETFDLPAWATLDIKTRDLPVGKHVNELHSGGVGRTFRGLPIADCNGKAPPSLKQSWGAIEDRLAEAKWSDGPMCRPYRATKLCGPWHFRVRFHQPTNATRIKPFTKLGAICWLGPLRRATAKTGPSGNAISRKITPIFFPAK